LSRREFAVEGVLGAGEFEDGDALLLWVDDPVFRDAGFGVVTAFFDVIAFAAFPILADNLYYKISAIPSPLVAAMIVFSFHEDDIRLADDPGTKADSQRSEKNAAEASLRDKSQKQAVQELKDHLMRFSGHFQDLHVTVGEFDKVVGFVGQVEVFVLRPHALRRIEAGNIPSVFGFGRRGFGGGDHGWIISQQTSAEADPTTLPFAHQSAKPL
jgi:hypothetical protein